MNDLKDLFLGIYGIPEAANYLSHTDPFRNKTGISSEKLRYWIRTSVPLISPLGLPITTHLISFNDLISMRMVAVMRSRGVPLNDIRKAEHYIREKFGLKYPFIMREVWTYGSDIFIHLENYLISASKCGQQAMEFLKEWVTKVDLDMSFDKNDFVESWIPSQGITLDPRIQIGMPCLSDTRIPSRSIYRKIVAGDSPEIIMDLYDISLSQLGQVISWEQRFEHDGKKTPIFA